MEYNLVFFRQLPSRLQEEYSRFLRGRALRDEGDSEIFLLALDQNDRIIGCGSRKKNLLKQLAVSAEAEGTGLMASIVSELKQEAADKGITQLFLWTKPALKKLFCSLGFYPLAETKEILMMDSKRNGLEEFLSSCPHLSGTVGSIVCSCNPFTLGHRKLMEWASSQCDHLLVFVLSEDAFLFSPEERFEMVQKGTEDLTNVIPIRGGSYVLSPSLFPTYFIKEESNIPIVQCQLDIELFSSKIAPELSISLRFAGSEPFDPVTREYNDQMRHFLPSRGIEFREMERSSNINATQIRKAIKSGELEKYRSWLPETSYEICRSKLK